MYLLLSVIAVFAVLAISELGWRKKWFDNEVGRKFVHITVGSFVAFWPFFLTWGQIRLLSVAFILGVAVSIRLRIFRAIHSVQRPTFGELCFGATVGLLTYITRDKGIYTAALLQMSLADGFAAIIGNKYGGGNTYHLFGHAKSVMGTTMFIAISVAVLTGYSVLSGHTLTPIDVAFAATIAAFFENITPMGFDNLVVPLFVGWLLTSL